MQNLSSPYIALPIPEKLVKICLVVPENSLLRSRPLKIFKEKQKKTSAKYIARQAGMPGGLICLPGGLNQHITNREIATQTNLIRQYHALHGYDNVGENGN